MLTLQKFITKQKAVLIVLVVSDVCTMTPATSELRNVGAAVHADILVL